MSHSRGISLLSSTSFLPDVNFEIVIEVPKSHIYFYCPTSLRSIVCRDKDLVWYNIILNYKKFSDCFRVSRTPF